MELLIKIGLFSLIPAVTMMAGGTISLVKTPSGNIRSLILHFAAGVVFSVVAVELLPDIVKEHQPVQVVIGFVLGIVVMTGVRKLTEEKKTEEVAVTRSKIPLALLIGVGVDIFIDGVLLGIGFAAGAEEGKLLALALSVELLSLGIAVTTELRNNDLSKRKAFYFVVALAGIFCVSSLLGATLLSTISEKSMEVVLSFGLSALLFLVTEELLIEAHEESETVWHTSAFFGGFLIFLILGMSV